MESQRRALEKYKKKKSGRELKCGDIPRNSPPISPGKKLQRGKNEFSAREKAPCSGKVTQNPEEPGNLEGKRG